MKIGRSLRAADEEGVIVKPMQQTTLLRTLAAGNNGQHNSALAEMHMLLVVS